MLGKRKRRADISDSGQQIDAPGDEDLRARFQRAFEAKFRPLGGVTPLKSAVSAPDLSSESNSDGDDDDDDDEDGEDRWSGLSDNDELVEVIRHDAVNRHPETQSHAMRSYMSSKPPTLSDEKVTRTATARKADEEEDSSEAANLKHDLALQRLLKESHLINPENPTTAGPEGKSRLQALDLRLQDLGAKKALAEQTKMPLAHRRGIQAKAAGREVSRRKEAAENGVILERKKGKLTARVGGGGGDVGGGGAERRERGIGNPSVGKFRGGTLRLSSRDVKSIEGPKQRGGGGRGRGRRR